jgi:hypothetical protein
MAIKSNARAHLSQAGVDAPAGDEESPLFTVASVRRMQVVILSLTPEITATSLPLRQVS